MNRLERLERMSEAERVLAAYDYLAELEAVARAAADAHQFEMRQGCPTCEALAPLLAEAEP